MPSSKWSNQYRRSRNGYAGRIGGPLNHKQKGALCILAKEAYALQVSDLSLENWRRAEQLRAVGKASLTDCGQEDFLALKAHFLHLAGEEGDALRAEQRHETEPERIALHKLKEACETAGFPASYPEAIAKDRFKRPLHRLNSKELWQLVFTVNNRARA